METMSNTKYIFISHNHPSGNVEPSLSDREATIKLKDTLHSLNRFELIDHIIVSDKGYLSIIAKEK